MSIETINVTLQLLDIYIYIYIDIDEKRLIKLFEEICLHLNTG